MATQTRGLAILVADAFVHKLRALATWAANNVSGSNDLIGEQKFRQRWSRYGVENTLAATDLWHEAMDEQQHAKVELDEVDAELRRLQSLTSGGLSPAADDPEPSP